MTSRAELLRLLAELDQQLAEVQDGFLLCRQTSAEATPQGRIIRGLRIAQESVERQLQREMATLAGN